jgi:biofilm PGA synthesis N-glycosyltransferase PgaC
MTDQLIGAGQGTVADPFVDDVLDDVARPPGRVPPARGGMHRSYLPGGEDDQRRFYVTVRTKFLVAAAVAALWVAFSVWLAIPWINDTASVIGLPAAVVLITLIAFIPGGLVSFLVASLMLDRQPALSAERPTAAVTVLIAARNEADGIGATVDFLAAQDYDGDLRVILVDNGSHDDTAVIALARAAESGLALTVLTETTPGKNNALNAALATVETPLVITVDADTLLHRSAVRLLLARYESAPDDVVAVAGSVLVRNSREGFWARVQEWDYFLGIASVKRMQGLYQGTLVAQGAFSLYETDAVRLIGGWPDAIGEDIVLTWKLLRLDCRVFFEPLAVAFTSAPEDLRTFARQRSRWARGMIEGLRTVPPWHQPRPMARVLTTVDLAIPFLDTAYILAWFPGVILACFGYYWLVGPMTIAVLPLTALAYAILFHRQWHHVFKPLGLKVRKNWLALAAFLFVYQILMSAVSVRGYVQELFGFNRKWK